jgi:hypothetical protein
MMKVDTERATDPAELPKPVAGAQTEPVLISAGLISPASSTRWDEKSHV